MKVLDTRIQLVYPQPEQPVFEDSTFLMGQAIGLKPEAALWIKDETGEREVPLSGQGFFSFQIPVRPGLNPVALTVRAPGESQPQAQELFAIYGQPPLAVLPASPLVVHAETVQPAGDVWLSEGDILTVACSASEGAEVSLKIPGLLETPWPLSPIKSDQEFIDNRSPIFAQLHQTRARIPVQSYYHASIPTDCLRKSASGLEGLPMSLLLQNGKERTEVPLPGTLSVLSSTRAAVLKTDAVARTFPQSGARLTPQKAGTAFRIDGLQDGWARARLGREQSLWLPCEALAFQDMPIVPGILELIRTKTTSDGAKIHFHFSGRENACPIRIEADVHRLILRFDQALSRCDFIQFDPADSLIQDICWQQIADESVDVTVDLRSPICGYDYAFADGEWILSLETLPVEPSNIRILIDPGHGGEETGATGLNGLPEKELNLTVSRLLAEALEEEGFQVRLTRAADETVSLESRALLAGDAHLVLSLHHNALPDGRDPAEHQGTSTYYYHPFARKFAQELLDGLTTSGGAFEIPNYGLLYDSLAMTRIHQASAVLVEIGFFTHPQEYERLIDPAFQAEVARRLAASVKQYCTQL